MCLFSPAYSIPASHPALNECIFRKCLQSAHAKFTFHRTRTAPAENARQRVRLGAPRSAQLQFAARVTPFAARRASGKTNRARVSRKASAGCGKLRRIYLVFGVLEIADWRQTTEIAEWGVRGSYFTANSTRGQYANADPTQIPPAAPDILQI